MMGYEGGVISSGDSQLQIRSGLSILQRIEPDFIGAPAFQAVAIDRLSDLLRARRIDRPRILVEVQASGIKWQVQPSEQMPHFAFDIVDEVLVTYPVNEAG